MVSPCAVHHGWYFEPTIYHHVHYIMDGSFEHNIKYHNVQYIMDSISGIKSAIIMCISSWMTQLLYSNYHPVHFELILWYHVHYILVVLLSITHVHYILYGTFDITKGITMCTTSRMIVLAKYMYKMLCAIRRGSYFQQTLCYMYHCVLYFYNDTSH